MNRNRGKQAEGAQTRQGLQDTVARLQLATAATHIGLYDFNPKTRAIHFSPEWKQQLGYADDELPNKYEEWESRLHPADRERTLQIVEDYVAGKRSEYVIEFRLRHRDGSYRWIYTRAEKEADPSGNAVRIYGCHVDITDRKETEQRLEEYQERLKALAAQLTIAEERERRRLATELHDTVSQSLALARVQMANARDLVESDEASVLLAETSATLLQALKSTRQIMADLSSPQISELGLGAAISEWLEEHVGARHGLETAFHAQGEEPTLNDDLKALLFRNVRELLANVVKHAKARKVSVLLAEENQRVKITVEDDGVGFDAEGAGLLKASDEGGFGLFSIQERMSDLGGSLSLDSTPGKGCVAVLTLPLTRS
jgi:two-component system sensor histidine kinase UhpB